MVNNMANKTFKTLDEQISILKERKLRIDDETEAKEFLRLNNYYRVSGYSLTLRDHDVFYENATLVILLRFICLTIACGTFC